MSSYAFGIATSAGPCKIPSVKVNLRQETVKVNFSTMDVKVKIKTVDIKVNPECKP